MEHNTTIAKEIKNTFWNLSQSYEKPYKSEGKKPIWFGAYDIINAHSEPFDMDAVAEKCALTHTTPDKKYYGMTKEEILTQWTTKSTSAKSSGSNLDLYMQCLFHKKTTPLIDVTLSPVQIQKELKLREYGDRFYNSLNNSKNIEFIGTELWVNDPTYGFRGKIDLLLRNKDTDTLLVLDHKQNEEITTENDYKNLLHTLSHVPDTDLNKMTNQLYAYRFALEKGLKTLVGSTAIAHYTIDWFKIIRPIIPYSEELMHKVLAHTRDYVIKTKYTQ